MLYQFFILFSLLVKVNALIGYDCSSKLLNITTLSLLDVGECAIPQDKINETKQYVQLLQLNEYTEATVVQCKLEIHRTIYQCGMFSHVSLVHNGESEYIFEIGDRACRDVHLTGALRLKDTQVIHGLRVNHTQIHPVMLAGSIGSDESCTGERYSDPYGTWDNVIVQGTIKITLQEYVARVSLNNDQIHLRSGTVCELSDGFCIDAEGGYTYWRPIPVDNCKFEQYAVLYEGYATKMVDLQIDNRQTVYSLQTHETTFALTAKARETVCGYELIKTEHPKLLIFETTRGETFARNNTVSVSNLDIFAYVNSKFIYVEKHIRTQMKQLYRDVIIQKCNLERQTLKNALTIATQAPDEFAYHLMKSPGYMAVVAGEVVHVIKCVPVEVKVEHGEECFAELQVLRSNETYSMTPRTRILKKKGTRISCNNLLPSYYFLGESWYKILPHPTEAIAPTMLKPNTQLTWKYTNPADLAVSGIYSDKDLNQLRERIMFPVERPAVLNDIAREITGHPVLNSDGTLLKLLNDNAITKIVESAWQRTWNKFITFGSISAGVIAIFTIIQAIKIIVDVILRGYTLHSVFGWSFRLLGALWGSITHVLLHYNTQTQLNTDPESGRAIPLRLIRTDATTNTTTTEEPKKKGHFSLDV